MTFRSFMTRTHRFLGALMSVLFVAWFVSGLVLIYHAYPKYSMDEELKHSTRLPESLPTTDSLHALFTSLQLDTVPLERLKVSGGTYADSRARLVIRPVEGERRELAFDGDSLRSLQLDRAYLETIAARWGQRIERIDTITELDQWTPFSRLTEDLPFYRLLLTGGAGHEVYVSSVTGDVLQESTRSERLWAWAGAIPHWIYFTYIRSRADLWRWVIIVLGAIGTFMALTGFYLGIVHYRSRAKKKAAKLFSPFPRKRYLGMTDYCTDLTALRQAEPELRALTFTSLGHIPVLKADGQEAHYYDGRSVAPKRLCLDSAEIVTEIRTVFGEGHHYTAELMDKYDTYYIHRAGKLPLPVWRIAIDTKDHHTYYVDPKTGMWRMYADSERIDAWMFMKLHRLQFAPLVNTPGAWPIVMWAFMLIGLITSLTGLMLAFDYVRRLLRRRGKKKH